MSDVFTRLAHTPPQRVPIKAARLIARSLRGWWRRRALERAPGELPDAAFLRALGGRFATTSEAVEHFRARREPRFFIEPAAARERARALARQYPRLAERTRLAAEHALRHEFDLLGSGLTALGPEIPWQVDFKTGHQWPLDLFETLDYLTPGLPADVKLPWELSRCYHWVALGRAYALDADPRYAREFAAQVESWLRGNPWPRGVNWGRAMEVAVRAVNWIWAAYFFVDSPHVGDDVFLRLLKSLVLHGRYIAENLEYSDNNGNHYLSNGVGLLFLGLLFPELAEASTWQRKGREIVWGELMRQVHPDGVDFEKGIGYQGLVLEFWYSCARLCELNGLEVPADVRERLERMFEFAQTYTRPDGTFPQIGDNDDGRLAGLDDEPVGTHRRHLAVGGVMFRRADLLGAAGEAVETALWLFGQEALNAPRQHKPPSSRGFPGGGFYVLRDEDDAVMVVDAGEVGMNGIGGHGHNDMLSFDLWAAGAPLIVDPGTYVYTADAPARQALRSTAAHNTVRVDGAELARMGNESWLWRIEDDAHPRVLRWETGPDADLLEAEHDGYGRLPEPVTHRRRILFARESKTWVVEDRLSGRGSHLVELYLHPASQAALGEIDGLLVRLRGATADLFVLPVEAPAGLELTVDQGWVSRGYGLREPAPVLRYAVRAACPVTITTVLMLLPSGTSAENARALLLAASSRDHSAAAAGSSTAVSAS